MSLCVQRGWGGGKAIDGISRSRDWEGLRLAVWPMCYVFPRHHHQDIKSQTRWQVS